MSSLKHAIVIASLFGLTTNVLAGTQVTLSTTQGDIQIELYDQQAPISSNNFLKYVTSGFYKGTIFHRVIPGFMVQAGGFTPNMQQKPTTFPAIKNEANNGLKNLRGTVAMARTGAINSATSQFFINTMDNPTLDHGVRDYGYAVFGRVTRGMDVVDNIANVPTSKKGMHFDVPLKPIIILDAKVSPKPF
ncbi:peptidylprolyl isomerase A [Acinetobacter puyangensis]|uniref:Peptidyl-prolyl cis-trans isomerase n=1 Tax=Acinetobacter puyangensis TaxID=1096779 RepID=A0A240EF06_9GAMM|nr:peptidylprolyl isomerase [Acinetobacter puyangensis]SNX46759.1 peptidyl-prolyl cis-trans isomerase A (cyclophilin A) [Acinetobacter puyangensis]